MSAADRAWRTVGFVGEVSAVMVAGLFELLSPRDKSGEHFAGAAASLAETSAREDKQQSASEPADPHTTSPEAETAWEIKGVRDNIAAPINTSMWCSWCGRLSWMCDANPCANRSPQPSPVTTHTSAGDSSAAAGTLPPTAAAEPLAWLGWAVPAICEVLAEHRFIDCSRENPGIDQPDWREHVAPLIAERIACNPARAIAALENFQPK